MAPPMQPSMAPPAAPPKGPHLPWRASGRSSGGGNRERISIAVTVALIVGLILGGGGWALSRAGSECSGKRQDLSVSADPAIAPAVGLVADRFNAGKCTAVKVVTAGSADTTGVLSNQTAAARSARPDVWIPDSSLWIDLVRQSGPGSGAVLSQPISVASSPLVFVVSADTAQRYGAELRQRSWDVLKPSAAGRPAAFSLRLPDPTQTATGMASLLVLQNVASRGGQADRTFTSMVQTAQQVQLSGPEQITAAYTALSQPGAGVPLLVDSEQSAWRQRRAGTGSQFTAVYPAQGTANLDFPYALTTADRGRQKLAAEFRSALQSENGAAKLQGIGLRTADGLAGRQLTGGGLMAAPPQIMSVVQPGAARGIQVAWGRLQSGTRILTLLDVSGSMLEPMPGQAASRIQATTQALSQGVSAMPDTAEFGLWPFSTDMDHGRPYTPLVPLAALRDPSPQGTQRGRLLAALAALKAKPNGNTGLYDSIQAAYREVSKGYRPGMVNIVLVLTDGRNDYKAGITLDALVTELKRSFHQETPVSVVAMGFGKDADMQALGRIAKATDGGAYQIADPRQIMQLFKEHMALKLCDNAQCPR
ncbi:MAG: von Willebrand factor, type [Actinomycetia bacterium]|nr:von Willebrand factor, type [Actinomycetes bacterium]